MSTAVIIAVCVVAVLALTWLENNQPWTWRWQRALVGLFVLGNALGLAEYLWEQRWGAAAAPTIGLACSLWWMLRLHEKIHRRNEIARLDASLHATEQR